MKMHNESRWWHQQSRNRVCDQYCGEIQDLVLIKTHIQISRLSNSLPLTSLQKSLDLGNELFGWWSKYLQFFHKKFYQRDLISERGWESEKNETNLSGCQWCLQMPWAGRALELQMCRRAAVQREICKMRWKRPRIWGVTDAGQRTESAALRLWLEEPSFRRGSWHFQQVLLVPTRASWLCQCQGGWRREFYQGLTFCTVSSSQQS